jgi:hypothetical protein
MVGAAWRRKPPRSGEDGRKLGDELKEGRIIERTDVRACRSVEAAPVT